jgi:hypothetical protein
MAENNSPNAAAAVSPAASPGWNQTVARVIALDETKVAEAVLTDTLACQRIQLISQDGRDLYIRRCTDAANKLHHPCSPSKLPADADTTVEEVGDALFKFAKP